MENEKCGLMPHNDDRYPVSRDWADIDCSAGSCKNNLSKKCTIPSIAVIGEDGKCKGYSPKRAEGSVKDSRSVTRVGD